MYYTPNLNLNIEIFEDGTIIYDSQNEEIFMLNESATFLYKNCKDKNRDTLIHYFISNIDKKYPMPSQQDIINECNMVIDTLVDKKIIIENGET